MIDIPCNYTIDTAGVAEELRPHAPADAMGECLCVDAVTQGAKFIAEAINSLIQKGVNPWRKKWSRKRLAKMLISRGMQRNSANELARYINKSGFSYAEFWTLAWMFGVV